MVLAWENLQEVFVMLAVVVVVLLTGGFYVSRFFSMSSALHLGFSGPWRPPTALSSTLATLGCFTFARLFRHIFPASATILSRHFLATGVFYLKLLPYIFGTFCDSDAGRNTPSRILLCVCPRRAVPSGWRMVLNYWYCSHKTIDLSIAPVSHKV